MFDDKYFIILVSIILV